MNNTKSFLFRYFLVALAAAAWSGGASAATVARTVLNDGSVVALSSAVAAVTPDGKIHVAAQGTLVADATNSSARQIYYMLFSASGQKLIDATIINTGGVSRKGRPQIAATADNKAVVTVTGGNGQALATYYMLVDPSGDDQSGDAAVPADILEVAQTAIGVTTSTGHHALAIDSAGIAHVMKAYSSSLGHIAFNPATSAITVAEHAVASVGQRRDPGFAIDSNDNLHVVYTGTGNGPATYAMFDNAGVELIGPTQLYNAEALDPHASHYSLAVDSTDNVHIVYGDKRHTLDADNWCSVCETAGTAVYTRLNPYLDAMDGGPADIAAIRVGTNETELGGYWYGRAYYVNGVLQFVSAGHHGRGNLTHLSITPGTTPSVNEPKVVVAQNGGANYSKHYPTRASNSLLWTEEGYSPTLTGVTTQLVMAALSDFTARPVAVADDDDGWLGCTLGSGKGPVDPLLPILAALAGLYLVRRRILPAGL